MTLGLFFSFFLWQLQLVCFWSRAELQRAHMHNQDAQPQAAKVLRQSMERELRQQVTQLEVRTISRIPVLHYRLPKSAPTELSVQEANRNCDMCCLMVLLHITWARQSADCAKCELWR